MSTLSLFHNTYRSTAAQPDQVDNLVVLHGWGMHSIVWDDVMPGLLEKFQVTVVDLPGMGQSPLPAGDYTLDYVVDQVVSVLPEPVCQNSKTHLLGWSLGGLVALQLAQQYQQQIDSVVTVATTPRFVSATGWEHAMKPEILEKFIEVFEEDHEGTLIRFLALNCKGSATMRDDIRKLKEILYFCGLPARKALLGGLQILTNTDLRDVLAKRQQPTLMIFGEKDHIVPAGVMTDIEKLNPGLQLAMIESVAHVPFLSAPDVFVKALMDFYREKGIAG